MADRKLSVGDDELAYMNYMKYVHMCIAATNHGVVMDTSRAQYCMNQAEKLNESLKSR
jgi:hypothetical protein